MVRRVSVDLWSNEKTLTITLVWAVVGDHKVGHRSEEKTPAISHLLGPSTLVLARTGADGVADQCPSWVVVVSEVQWQVLVWDRAEQAQLALKLGFVEVSVDQRYFRVVVDLRTAASHLPVTTSTTTTTMMTNCDDVLTTSLR